MDRVINDFFLRFDVDPRAWLATAMALTMGLSWLAVRWLRNRNRRRRKRELIKQAWAEETKRLQSRKRTWAGDGPKPEEDSAPTSEKALLAMPTSTTENLIGIKIARQLRVVCVSNCESSDLADLRLRELAHNAGAGGIINYKISVQSDGRFWAEGDAVLLTPSLTNGSTPNDQTEEVPPKPVRK